MPVLHIFALVGFLTSYIKYCGNFLNVTKQLLFDEAKRVSGFKNSYEMAYFGAELTGPVIEKRHATYGILSSGLDIDA